MSLINLEDYDRAGYLFPCDTENVPAMPVQLRRLVVDLTNDEIKAIPTARTVRIAAPGVGLVIYPLIARIFQNLVAGYTGGVWAGEFRFSLGADATYPARFSATGLGAAGKTISTTFVFNGGVDWSLLSNQPMYFFADNAGNQLAGGNAANIIRVEFLYFIFNLNGL